MVLGGFRSFHVLVTTCYILTSVKAESFLVCDSRWIVRSIHAKVTDNISPKQ